MIEYLVSQKADTNIQDNDGVSILDYTTEGENIADLSSLIILDKPIIRNIWSVWLMLTKHCRMWKLVKSCMSHTATLSLLLYQQTPLHIAAGKGFKVTSTLLVDGGAEVNKKNKTGVSINTTVEFQVHVKEPCTQCLHTENVYICVILYATLMQNSSCNLYVSLMWTGDCQYSCSKACGSTHKVPTAAGSETPLLSSEVFWPAWKLVISCFCPLEDFLASGR